MLKEKNDITDAIVQLIQSLPETQQKKIVKKISGKKRGSGKKSEEEKLWRDASAQNFLRQYGEHEPDYTKADIREPNFAVFLLAKKKR